MNTSEKTIAVPRQRARNVTAVLGPTNTGKTHLAIERMLGHETGIIGLPLRLLAREVYGRIVERIGADQVALITGEEKIKPENPRFSVCTVEAMPRETDADFAAIDEIQLAGDLERGHVFTDRLLHLRGVSETLLLGAATMQPIIEKLLPGVDVVTRPRMSQLAYAGSKKLTRLPRRSAIVAFSADEVYAIAELIRRQRGGAAVVLGSLSPRTRNAQVALYQSGEVDFLVATDAIGMGLNLDVDHIAFASTRKFDGFQHRQLTPAELGQVAGRAGRHTSDGTFGVTSRGEPFDDKLVETLETHHFDPVRVLQWRNREIDASSLAALRRSLERIPKDPGLTRAPPAIDVEALEILARDREIAELAVGENHVALLWEVCQVPDYRRIAPANHADLVAQLYTYLMRDDVIAEDWFDRQVAYCDQVEGDIDTIANRIAHIRTWTFLAHRPDWLADPGHWQERTRQIEDKLSDALHQRLMQRFVDRRTSVLMRRLRENAMLEAEVTSSGDVLVENQHVGHLHGFRFAPDAGADGPEAKALRAAAQKALASEIDRRAERVAVAPNEDLVLGSDGSLRWRGEAVAKLAAGADTLAPSIVLLADEQLTGVARERVEARLLAWIGHHVAGLLGPLVDLAKAENLDGIARGVAFRIVEALGILDRKTVAEDIRALDQTARAGMRKYGVRFGAYHIYLPALMKPGPRGLIVMLWALQNGGLDQPGLDELPHLAHSGRTSIPIDHDLPKLLYRLVGYRICGERAVRVDILERLADLIRPLLAWRPSGGEAPPEGAVDGRGFAATVAMTSLVGCAGEDFASILKSLGYRSEKRKVKRPVTGRGDAAPQPGAADADAKPEAQTETAAAASDDKTSCEAEPAPVAEVTSEPEAAPPVAEAIAEPEPAALAESALAETAPADAAPEPAAEAEPAAAPEPAAVTDDVATDTTPTESAEAGDAAAPAAPAGEDEVAPGGAAETASAGDGEAAPAAEAAPEAASAAEEEVEIDVWRPGRFDHGHRGRKPAARVASAGEDKNNGRPAGGRATKRGRKDRGKDGAHHAAKTHGGKPQRPAKPERRGPDPDSPFAALAALKKDLESRGKDG